MSTRAKLANKVIWTLVFIGALFLAAGLSTLPDHQSLFIVLGVMGVCAALVITLRPWKLLLTMALVTPFQVYLHLGPYPVAIGYMLIGLLAISWSLYVLMGSKTIYFPRLLIPATCFVMALLMSLKNAADVYNFVLAFSQNVAYVIFYFISVNVIKTPLQLKKLVRVLVIGALGSALLGFAQFGMNWALGSDAVLKLFYVKLGHWVFGSRSLERIGNPFGTTMGYFFRGDLEGFGNAFRPFGMFGGANPYAFYHATMFVLMLGFVLHLRRARSLCSLLGLEVLLLAALLPLSRTAWLMLFVGVVFFLSGLDLGRYISSSRLRLVFRYLFLGIVCLGLAFLLALVFPSSPLSKAFLDTVFRTDASTISRTNSMLTAIDLFLERPLIGGGFGNYPVLVDPARLGTASRLTAESTYLQLMTETGLLGLTCYLWLQAYSWFEAWRLFRSARQAELRGFAYGFLGVWLAVFVGRFFAANLTNPRGMLIWWLLVAMVSAARHVSTMEE